MKTVTSIDTDSNKINSVEKEISKYRNHPSVNSRLKDIPGSSFNELALSEKERELELINPRNHVKSIPPKLLRSTKTTCSETLKTIFNNCLIKAKFPNELELADVTPILKKKRSFPG